MGQKGQIVLILILIMSVALTIGLAIVQKSLVDVSTSSKVEQSSRAFSAAEAGVEKALKESDTTNHSTVNFSGNNSQVKGIVDTGLIPPVPEPGHRQTPLEMPPLAKEEVTQVWLADFNSYSNPPSLFYTQNTLNVYWGNSPSDKDPVAIEITLIYHDGTKYEYMKWYLDQVKRNPSNGFEVVANCQGNQTPPDGGLATYQCLKTIGGSSGSCTSEQRRVPNNNCPLPPSPILLRARLLYNTTSQPFALQSAVTCPLSAPTCIPFSIPPQGRIVVSTGASGETERRVKVFQLEKVLPPYFDYAIFSAGEITK